MRSALFLALLTTCGPRVNPAGPEADPTVAESGSGTTPPKALPTSSVSREVIVGEMCPAAKDGRPAIMPTFMRRISWDDDRERISDVLSRGMAKQFSVFGWQGKRVGLFTSVGASKSGGHTHAMGSYAGGSACETAGVNPRAVPECEQAMLSCGLALGVLRSSGGHGSAPFEEDPDPDEFKVGGACMSGKHLVLDVDGDGRTESFPASEFLNSFREPSDEVVATHGKTATCDTQFAIRGVLAAADPRDWRGLDLLGVVDLDGDDRFELVLAFNYQDRRTWAVFSPQSSSGRLDLVAEGQPWPRPQTSKAQPVSASDLKE